MLHYPGCFVYVPPWLMNYVVDSQPDFLYVPADQMLTSGLQAALDTQHY